MPEPKLKTSPDLPKFDALRDFLDGPGRMGEQDLLAVKGWVDKLEEWSKDRLEERRQLQDQVQGYEESEQEILADADTFKWMQHDMHDVRLGIMDVEEFFAEWMDVPPWIGERKQGGPL